MTENNTQGFKELPPGTTLHNGKYTIVAKIGEGGFGITYKAIQTGLEKTVCIKEFFLAGKCVRNTQAKTVHLQGISEDMFEKYRQAFVKEARTLSSLRHPNIVEVNDIFDENNTSYMVMSFIEGQSSQKIVDANGKLTYHEAVNYLGQITDAVGYIHEKNVLHRDIKPDNVMITPDNRAVLIDFGSAREFEHDKTQVHTSMLTHGYAPTEQYTANSRKGYYTDIYAIGATLYFTLTGQVPIEAAARITEEMPAPQELNPEIPDAANRTILKAMQIKATNRHQSIQEFKDDLTNKKPSTIVDERIGSGIDKRKWLWFILAALLVGAVVVGFVINNSNKKRELERQIAEHTEKVAEFNMPTADVFWNDSSPYYHLFYNCIRTTNSGNVRGAFESNRRQLCSVCVSNVERYRQYLTNARDANAAAGDFSLMGNETRANHFFDRALDYTNRALQMRPDNESMTRLRNNIRNRR